MARQTTLERLKQRDAERQQRDAETPPGQPAQPVTQRQRRAELVEEQLEGVPPIPQPVPVDMQSPLPGITAPVVGAGLQLAEDPAGTLMPHAGMIGSTIGGLTFGVPGAVVGGALGKGAQQMYETAYGDLEEVPTPTEAIGEMALEGAIQGATEGIGRTVFSGGGALLRLLGPTLRKFTGSTAKAVGETATQALKRMPESVGQVRMGADNAWADLALKLERYLGSSWVGAPLREVRRVQQQVSRDILAILSRVDERILKRAGVASKETLAENWDSAKVAIRLEAHPLYAQIDEVVMPQTGMAATKILDDLGEVITGPAKTSLRNLSKGGGDIKLLESGTEEAARALGFSNLAEAYTKQPYLRNSEIFETALKELQSEGLTAPAVITGELALKALHDLGELATRLTRTDPSQGRLVWQARNRLDNAITRSLTPELKAVKAEADLLWRQSYIMDDIFENLWGAQRKQVGQAVAPPNINISSFTELIQKLAYQEAVPIAGEAGKRVGRSSSKLEALFENPADRKAMVDLADFLESKTKQGAGAAGLSEAIANIGTALMALSVPIGVATGIVTEDPKLGGGAAVGYLGFLYGLSSLLARGKGARSLLTYFRSPTAGGAAALARLAYETGVAEDVARDVGEGIGLLPARIPEPLPPNVNIPVN
jgi:hypothetical protein